MSKSERQQHTQYIICTLPYRNNSAGIRALYFLAEALRQRGCLAFTTTLGSHKSSNEPHHLTESEARARAGTLDWIVIYPEVISGNPLHAKKVVRWVLNRPGFLGGDLVYNKNELVFSYSNVYLNYIYNPVAGVLYIPTIDQKLFFPDSNEQKRTEICFYIGKSKFKSGHFDPHQAIEITQTTPRRETLGELFRKSHVFYCFDNSTILVYEAILCGCPAVIIPDGSHTRKDYETLELGMNGIAWGPSELEQAKSTVHFMPSHYNQIQNQFEAQLQKFIAITTEWKLPPYSSRIPKITVQLKFLSKKYLRQLKSKFYQLPCLRKPNR